MKSLFRRKTVLIVVVVIAVFGLAGGFLMGIPSEVPPAYAAVCRAPNTPACHYLAPYRTAAVDVDHATANTDPVEVDDTVTWNITATWNTAPPPECFEYTETAAATVKWTGSAWELSSTTTTPNITNITICDSTDTCASGGTVHDHAYRLIAQVYDPVTVEFLNYNLRQTLFATTSVDDGYVIDTDACTLGASVSPTSQVFSSLHNGAGTCGYSCSYSGTSLTITYR